MFSALFSYLLHGTSCPVLIGVDVPSVIFLVEVGREGESHHHTLYFPAVINVGTVPSDGP